MKKFIRIIWVGLGMGSSVMGMIQENPNRVLPTHWIQSNNNSQEHDDETDLSRKIPQPKYLKKTSSCNDLTHLPKKLPNSPSCDSLLNQSYEELPPTENISPTDIPVVQSYPVSKDENHGGSIRVIHHWRHHLYPDYYQPPAFQENSDTPLEASLQTDPHPHHQSPSTQGPPPPPFPSIDSPDQPRSNPSIASKELNEWGTWLSQVPRGKAVLCVGAFFACYGAMRCFNDRKKYWLVIKPFLKKYLPLFLAKKKNRKKKKNEVYLSPTS